jgi:hypothetical protein
MGFFPSADGGPHIDKLILGQLKAPMLTQVMQSMHMRADLGVIANKIKVNYLAGYQRVARESGNLGSTAKVTYHRERTRYDNRWVADFTVGGPKAPYVIQVEEEHHLLAQALRDMGYNIGDIVHVAPPQPAQPDPPRSSDTGQLKASLSDSYRQMAEAVDRIQKPGRRIGSRAMERDVAEVRRLIAESEAQGKADDASFGRMALSSYDLIKRERAARDERLRGDS